MSIDRVNDLRFVSRRRLIAATGLAGAAIALDGLREARAAVEPQVNMMGWSTYIAPNNISDWEKANNCKMIYDSYSSNDEMYSKLQLAQGPSGYDLGMNTDFMIKLLIDKQLLAKLDKSMIPNIGNIQPEFADPGYDPGNLYTVPKCTGSEGFIYDKTVVTRPMKTWGDFLEAIENEASGQVSLLDDPLAIAPLFWSKGLSWNTTDEAALKDAETRVETLAKHIKSFNSSPTQDIATGSLILAQCWNGTAKRAIEQSKNANLVFVYPEPKSEIWIDNYHMPIGGKSPKAAHSFLNHMLDPRTAATETTYNGFLSPVTGAGKFLDAAVAQDPLIFPPAEAIKRGERTVRNETYDRRIAMLTKFKAAAAR